MFFIHSFIPRVPAPLSLCDQNKENMSSIRELEAREVSFLNLVFKLMELFVTVLSVKTELSSCYHILFFCPLNISCPL